MKTTKHDKNISERREYQTEQTWLRLSVTNRKTCGIIEDQAHQNETENRASRTITTGCSTSHLAETEKETMNQVAKEIYCTLHRKKKATIQSSKPKTDSSRWTPERESNSRNDREERKKLTNEKWTMK